MKRTVAVFAAASFAFAAGAAFAHDAGNAPATLSATAAAEIEALPTVDELPEGVVQLSPFVPGMGEHWADPKNMPLGPIYCVMDGHLTCMEYMISQEDFAAGRSFTELRPWFDGGKQPPIDHIEFNFEPHGHEGYEIPHYDVHMYFVSPETRQARTQAQR